MNLTIPVSSLFGGRRFDSDHIELVQKFRLRLTVGHEPKLEVSHSGPKHFLFVLWAVLLNKFSVELIEFDRTM